MPDGISEDLTSFHAALEAESLAPLWERLCVTLRRANHGRKPYRSTGGRDRLREHALTAGQPDHGPRRRNVGSLCWKNPGLKGQSQITTSLYAGIQTILPGEVAPDPPS